MLYCSILTQSDSLFDLEQLVVLDVYTDKCAAQQFVQKNSTSYLHNNKTCDSSDLYEK